MTLRLGRIFLMALALFLTGAVFCVWRAFQFRDRLPEMLTAQAEKHLGVRLSFERANLVFAPLPVLRMVHPRLESMKDAFSPWTAGEAQFGFRLPPLLWGRVQFSGFRLQGGAGNLGGIPLRGVELKVRHLGSRRFASFEGKAKGSGGKEIFRAGGKLSFENPGENFWKGFALKGEIHFPSFSPRAELPPEILERVPAFFQESRWKGSVRFNKEREAEAMAGTAEWAVENLVAPKAEALSLTGAGTASWNFRTGLLEFKQVSLQSPLGELSASGVWNGETREIKEARFIGRKVVLENSLRAIPGLNRALPLETGVSGESEFDLTLRGSWDYLSLHANWNLTPAVLTYGKVFSKPKDFPMGVNFDLLLKGGSLLSGDFSTRIGDTTVKGAVVTLDLKNGTGELTLLTNKFNLKDWVPLLSPLASYTVSGEVKVLLSVKGNLLHLRQTEKIMNLTLDRVALVTPEGRGLQEGTGRVDVSPLNLRVQDTVLKLGGGSLQAKAEIYNFYENPQGTFQLLSPRVEPGVLLENLEALHAAEFFQRILPSRSRIETEVRRFLPPDVPLEEFTLKGEIAPDKLTIRELAFRALAGGVQIQAERDRSGGTPRFWLQLQLDQISLTRLFEAQGHPEEGLEGNLFFTGQFNAEGWKPGEFSKALKGTGSLSVTNGEWHSLNLFAPLGGLEEFNVLPPSASGATPFHDLKAQWSFREGRFETEEFLLDSGDCWVEGKGNLSLEGTLNARLEAYLSGELTQQLLRSWESDEEAGGRRLGPIPLLMVGGFTRPELKVDDRALSPLLESIRDRRFRRILSRPFED